MPFTTLGLGPKTHAGAQGKRLRRADADPGEGDSRHPRRARRHRRRADRHRQDRGVRAAAARAPGRGAAAAHHARAGRSRRRASWSRRSRRTSAPTARHLPLRYATIFGGVGEGPQIQALRRGVDIVVATPGRLIDLMEQRHVDFAALQVLVLDEADRMLDMGFLPPIRRIVAATPATRQTLLFSATMSKEIEGVAKECPEDTRRWWRSARDRRRPKR